VIRTHDLSKRAAADLLLRPRGYWDRLPKHGVEGKYMVKIEVTGKEGKIHKQLLDKLKAKDRKSKEETLDRAVWKTRSGRGYGSVVR